MEEITLPQSQQVEEAAAAVTALPMAVPEASAAAPPPPPSDVLRLRGLPFAATEAEVVDFFKDFELKGSPLLCKRNGAVNAKLRPIRNSSNLGCDSKVELRESAMSSWVVKTRLRRPPLLWRH
jgi:hypothetical protein